MLATPSCIPPVPDGNSFPLQPIGSARATDCQRDGKVLPPEVYPLQMIAPAGVGVLQKPGDIFKISEIEVQKGLPGLLPGAGTLSSSTPFFSCGTPHARVYAATRDRLSTS